MDELKSGIKERKYKEISGLFFENKDDCIISLNIYKYCLKKLVSL